MKYFAKVMLVLILVAGYAVNMYFLTVDPNRRDYQALNKIGIVLVPLGSVMGAVYAMDKSNIARTGDCK